MKDFIILGAGFAGLQAGIELKKQNKDFLIIEPREVVGGRVFSDFYKGNTIIELGGQWVGPLHTNLLKTIKKYNLKTYDSPYKREENHIYISNNIKSNHTSKEINKFIDHIESLIKDIDLENIWTHPKAKEWDNITLEEYLRTILEDESDIRFVGKLLAGNLLSCSASEASLLQTLFYVASSQSFNFLLSFKNGAQEKRVVGGMASVAQAMAKDLGQNYIKLNEYAIEIIKQGDHYLVKTNKDEYYTKKVIITCPPKLICNLKFTPALPKKHFEWFDSYQKGKAFKFHFVYDNDFWGKESKSGYFFNEKGLITEATDNCSPDSKYHVYTGFVYGKDKDKLYMNAKTKEERAEIISDNIAKVFGDEAKNYLEFYEYDWAEQPNQYSCFVSRPQMGLWTKLGKDVWRKPVDDSIYFIGTENSSEFNGYIEGALRSAIRLVKEIK